MPKFTSDIKEKFSIDPIVFDSNVWKKTATELNLKYLANHAELVDDLKASGLSVKEAVLHALRVEHAYRARHKVDLNMSLAKFPDDSPSLETFDFSVSQVDESEIRELALCNWIAEGKNLLFHGGSGLGKTHLAIAIGKKAIVDKAYSVRFITATDLMDLLTEARDDNRVDEKLKILNRSDLIILDEFGYPLMEDQKYNSSLFYAFISSRYEKKSILMTTNRAIRDWPRYLNNDVTLCQACVDRFFHHCLDVSFKGPSYRLRDLKKRRLSADPEKQSLANDVLG